MSAKNKKNGPRFEDGEEAVSGLKPEDGGREAENAGNGAGEAEKKSGPSCEDLLNEEKTKYAYLMAEYQNYRKRSGKDISDARFNGMAETLAAFLKVSDFLDMASQAAEKSDNIDAIRQGLKMIIAEYGKCFDELGVKKLKSAGEKFDPALHEAVAHEPSGEVAENHIIREWSAGYTLGSKLLRPARVVVSSGPETEKTEQSE